MKDLKGSPTKVLEQQFHTYVLNASLSFLEDEELARSELDLLERAPPLVALREPALQQQPLLRHVTLQNKLLW